MINFKTLHMCTILFVFAELTLLHRCEIQLLMERLFDENEKDIRFQLKKLFYGQDLPHVHIILLL